jgi:arylsulfatase A
MMFMDAHTTSSVCSPSRYSIITGQYNWRTRLQSGVLHGLSPPLLRTGQATVGTVLKSAGYKTGFVGKWHVGLKFNINMLDHLNPNDHYKNLNFSHHIEDGPFHNGFDEFFGLTASLDIPPYVYIRDRNFVSDNKHVNHGATNSIINWGRAGPVANGFNAEETLDVLLNESKAFLKKHIRPNFQYGVDKPVFLFLSLTSPHTPVLPTAPFRGKSDVGKYGDFMMQTDDVVGQIMKQLEELNALNNTLLMFTSDNGFSNAGMQNVKAKKPHHANGPFRGQKSDIYEGGHRIPFSMQWPGVIEPGSRVNDVVSMADLYATFADIVGARKTPEAGPDSYSLLPLMITNMTESYQRDYTILHSLNGKFGIRHKQFMLAFCPDSGGWTPSRAATPKPPGYGHMQLWDLEKDQSQTKDLLQGTTLSADIQRLVEELRVHFKNITGRHQRRR